MPQRLLPASKRSARSGRTTTRCCMPRRKDNPTEGCQNRESQLRRSRMVTLQQCEPAGTIEPDEPWLLTGMRCGAEGSPEVNEYGGVRDGHMPPVQLAPSYLTRWVHRLGEDSGSSHEPDGHRVRASAHPLRPWNRWVAPSRRSCGANLNDDEGGTGPALTHRASTNGSNGRRKTIPAWSPRREPNVGSTAYP
jgi:hypothetical protein